MSYFESLTRKVAQIQPATGIKQDFSNLSQNAFRNGIQSAYNSMDIPHLAVYIKNNIDEIVSDIKTKDIPYICFFRDRKFIDAFITAINSIPMSYNLRHACNNLAYDYFTSSDPDTDIKQKYLEISRVVNRADISKLMSLGLDENTASNLALCRYSSDKETVNVKRLNFALYFKSPDVMTEQMIVYIYEKLFDKIRDLFISTMTETYSEIDKQNFGTNFIEVYGRVGNAVLDIVNNMTSENIRILLCAYHEAQKTSNCSVRFSLRSLSNDYSRILRVVEMLEREHNIYIP